MVTIKTYDHLDQEKLFDLIRDEGAEWEAYFLTRKEAYLKTLSSSLVYLLFEDDLCIGYIRVRDDDSFGLYVYDLLVRKSHRGKNYGKMMFEHVKKNFPSDDLYVMSDVDPYYESLGFEKIGSIFKVNV